MLKKPILNTIAFILFFSPFIVSCTNTISTKDLNLSEKTEAEKVKIIRDRIELNILGHKANAFVTIPRSSKIKDKGSIRVTEVSYPITVGEDIRYENLVEITTFSNIPNSAFYIQENTQKYKVYTLGGKLDIKNIKISKQNSQSKEPDSIRLTLEPL